MARSEFCSAGRGWTFAGVCLILASVLEPVSLAAQEVNLDSRVRLQFGGFRFDRTEQVFSTSGTLTNISSDLVLEPLSLVLTSMSPGVTLANPSGQTDDGRPFVTVPLTDGFLGPGERLQAVILKFTNPSQRDIRFTTTVRGGVSMVESVLQTQGELMGVAVAPDGTVYVSDVKHGEIIKLDPAGSATVAAAGLRRPSGLALDGADLLIAEEGAGRVLRMTPGGALSVIAQGVRAPRWVARGYDGTIYTTVDERSIVRRDPLTGRLDVVATGVHQLEALALNGTALFAAARWVDGLSPSQGVIASYGLFPDGRLKLPVYFVPSGLQDPRGLVLDSLASLYVTHRSRAIVKAHADAHLTPFAPLLSDPRGLALGPDGSLYVADGRSGRLLRFRAPPPPGLAGLPAFTKESPLMVSGTTVPIARVDLFVNDATTATTGFADGRGVFSVAAPLALNAKNTLEVFATARRGEGLTSAPALATVAHDNQPPALSFLAPPANAFVRQTVNVQAQASGGGGSPVTSLGVSVGGKSLTVTLSPAPPAPSITATGSWNTSGIADGAQTLTAAATDQAGNAATVTRVVIVDNTPPDTQITAGPSGPITDTSATFTVTGTDNLTPVPRLQYAWRLDSGPYSAFDPNTQILLSGLAAGAHTFEVKARDLAGNEDPTPALQSFAVNSLSIQVTSPPAGATVQAGLLLVRGSVSTGGADAGVTVNGRPAAIRGSAFAALVAVDQGTTQLVAVATTVTGAATSSSIPIGVNGNPSDAVIVRPSPESGTAPLRVSFSVSAPRSVAQVGLDFDGDGSVDFRGASLDGRTFTYSQPGLYVASAVITDVQGDSVTASAVVQVLDQAGFDTVLRNKWGIMKDALRAGDIPGALDVIALGARDSYRDFFAALQPRLSQIDAILTDIQWVSFDPGRAEYQMLRADGGVALSYMVVFVQDEDGIWRLEFF